MKGATGASRFDFLMKEVSSSVQPFIDAYD